tara:strand:+ start:9313 stop:9750 length:438 start_codon:yes stop_codon:yes gene_type:complete
MSKVHTTDKLALHVAEQAYEVVRTARNAQGAQDLPSWDQVPDLKQLYLTNAARASLDGSEVWDVWSLSCGEKPDDATQVLWKSRRGLLQLLPKTFVSFGRAVVFAGNVDVGGEEVPTEEVDEEVPTEEVDEEVVDLEEDPEEQEE